MANSGPRSQPTSGPCGSGSDAWSILNNEHVLFDMRFSCVFFHKVIFTIREILLPEGLLGLLVLDHSRPPVHAVLALIPKAY